MTPTAVLAELHGRGVELVVDGERLHYRAPRGALTPELREAMRSLKPALLTVLTELPCLGPSEPLPNLPAEEALYRLWWRTLPSERLARQRGGHLGYWQDQRGLSDEALAWLRGRVQDLLSTPRTPEES